LQNILGSILIIITSFFHVNTSIAHSSAIESIQVSPGVGTVVSRIFFSARYRFSSDIFSGHLIKEAGTDPDNSIERQDKIPFVSPIGQVGLGLSPRKLCKKGNKGYPTILNIQGEKESY